MKRNKKDLCGIYGIRVDTDIGPFFYVGKSTHINQRIKQHVAASQTSSKQHIDKAIAKYPWEWEVIRLCGESYLNEKEQKYIAKYNTFKRGYNNTMGGDSSYQSSIRELGPKEIWPPH